MTLWMRVAVIIAGVLSLSPPPVAGRLSFSPDATARRSGAYVDEGHFIVSETIGALVTLARLGGGATGEALVSPARSSGEGTVDPVFRLPGPEFDVVLPGETSALRLRLTEYIWSPADYQVVARPLAGRLRRGHESIMKKDRRVLEQLLDARVATLEDLDDEISGALEQDPRDATAHEEAALLVGTFALRDSSALFQDGRLALCRMGAHLAMAQALQGASGLARPGRMAEVLLLALAQRQSDAESKLRSLGPPRTASERAFQNVLDLTVVQDWRRLASPEQASLLERVTYARARSWKTDSDQLNTFIDSLPAEDIPDWGRLALTSDMSVENCGRWAEPAVGRELAEIQDVARRSLGDRLPPGLLVPALNQASEGPIVRWAGRERLRVLDWGLWADFERRHLLSALQLHHECLAQTYGLPDKARAFRASVRSLYSGLGLFPLLWYRLATTPAEYAEGVSGATLLCREHPELVVGANWMSFTYPSGLGSAASVRPPREWFAPLLPWGTAFDFNRRLWIGGKVALGREPLEALMAMAPYYGILRTVVGQVRWGAKPPYAELKALYGPLAEYGSDVLRELAGAAERDAPEAYPGVARQLCALSIDDCEALARHLQARGKEEDAAQMLRRWARDSRDRVFVANNLEWLVRYDEEHGRPDEALALAQEAASTFSGRGLCTLADLLERRGDRAAAESYFKKAAERYQRPDLLIHFYQRQPGYEKTLTALLESLFPQGRPTVELAALTGPPESGVLVSTEPTADSATPLRFRDVLVGVNGERARDRLQFEALRAAGCPPKAGESRVFVFRGGGYQVVTLRCDQAYDVGLETYAAR